MSRGPFFRCTRCGKFSGSPIRGEFVPEPPFEPEGYTLPTYAAFQVFAAAAEGAGGWDGEKMANWLKSHSVDTVIGKLSWDNKGDLKAPRYSWYVWHNGKFTLEKE